MRKGLFRLSSNIRDGYFNKDSYIVTPNAKRISGLIADEFKSGIHSFTIVGAYGTGKSSFLLCFEQDLKEGGPKAVLMSPDVFNSDGGFEIINIVGDYTELATLLQSQLNYASNKGSILDQLNSYYKQLENEGKFLVIVIDEFGKILEHAAKNNPERELYFLQKFAEFVNLPTRKILLLTTLHQNFGTYSKGLTENQINEWVKVKGRFRELTFIEPVEQLLYLAAKQNRGVKIIHQNAEVLNHLGHETKFVSGMFSEEVSNALYPLDPFAAYTLTSALQRYGQNERSLFSFLAYDGEDSLSKSVSGSHLTYHLGRVYDYISFNFYSYLRESNADSIRWGAMPMGIERVECLDWKDETQKENAISIVKAIGLLGLFGNAGFSLDDRQMAVYAREAMDIEDGELILKQLIQHKIIRFAKYKNRLILFDGTDIDIENEIRKAGLIVDRPVDIAGDISLMLSRSIVPVKAHYYKTGTPRYFRYEALSEPVELPLCGDIDGLVELIFSTRDDIRQVVKEFSRHHRSATVYAVFCNTEFIVEHLYNIKKYEYILERVVKGDEDRVAKREIEQLKAYESQLLNKAINEGMFVNNDVAWFYNGERYQVDSHKKLNVLLSNICDDIYAEAPMVNNELFNKHSLSTSITTAKKKYLNALVEHSDEPDLGFPRDSFPPEKTIYLSLLKETGLFNGERWASRPTDIGFERLWDVCEAFLSSTERKARNVQDLIRILSSAPFKMKQGFLDFWIPTYLYLKRQEFALYYTNQDKTFVPEITKEVFEVFQKNPSSFALKKYSEDGVKLEFFRKYRQIVNLDSEVAVRNGSFIETIKPFLAFYARLNDYAKHTRKFNHVTTSRFRDVLASAKDPEKAFLEDIPEALGFHQGNPRQESSMEEFEKTLQQSINELRLCYDNLITRIEQHLLKELGIASIDYDIYISEIRKRLSNVKAFLLTEKQKEFYNRIMTKYESRREWFESVCFVLLDKQLYKMNDEQEEKLLNDFVYLFRVCEKYADIALKTNGKEDSIAYSFDLVSNQGTSIRTQTFVLPKDEDGRIAALELQIESILSGNENLDVCALLTMLNKRLSR